MSKKSQKNNQAMVKHSLAMLKSSLHGHPNRLRMQDPPQVNRRPFNNIVVQQTLVSDGTSLGISVSSLVKALTSQLGLVANDQTIMCIKLHRCDVWAISKANSTVRPSVNCDYSSLIPQVGDPTTPGNAIVAYPMLKRLEDIGGVSSAARVSYSWPKAMADQPLNLNADFILINVASNMTEIDIRWHLHWSTTDIQTPLP